MIAGWRSPGRDDRQVAWLAFGLCVSAVALSPLGPLVSRLLPPCLLRQWSGLPCPTCGSTRAILALARLDVAGALQTNPLTAVAVAGALVAGALAPWWLLAGGKIPRLTRAGRRGLGWGILAAVAANWVYLAVSGT